MQTIVERYAEAIVLVDDAVTSSGANARTGEVYLPGFLSMNEEPAVAAIDYEWEMLYPGERQAHRMGIRYPGLPGSAKCDHVLTTDGLSPAEDEWGIEVKRLQFFGNNGKRNDFSTTKVLSPYLKDRGLIHDALRLRDHGFTRRVAVLGYSFDYDSATLAESEKRHTTAAARAVIGEIREVIKGGGALRTRSLIDFADAILGLRGMTTGPRAQAEFEAWRHPAGGRGVVFGWEVRRPQLEPDYDPRHPW